MLSIARPSYNVANYPQIPKMDNTFVLQYSKTIINNDYVDGNLNDPEDIPSSFSVRGAVFHGGKTHIAYRQTRFSPAGHAMNICTLESDGSVTLKEEILTNVTGGAGFEGFGRWFTYPLNTGLTSLSSIRIYRFEDDASITNLLCSLPWPGTTPFSGTFSNWTVRNPRLSGDGLTLIAEVSGNLTSGGVTYYGASFLRVWKRATVSSSAFSHVVDRTQPNYLSEFPSSAGINYGTFVSSINMAYDGSTIMVQWLNNQTNVAKYYLLTYNGTTYTVASVDVSYPIGTYGNIVFNNNTKNQFDCRWAHRGSLAVSNRSLYTNPYDYFYSNYTPITADSISRAGDFVIDRMYSYTPNSTSYGGVFEHVLRMDSEELIVFKVSTKELAARYSIRDLLPSNHPLIVEGNTGASVFFVRLLCFVDGANKLLLHFTSPTENRIVEYDYSIVT